MFVSAGAMTMNAVTMRNERSGNGKVVFSPHGTEKKLSGLEGIRHLLLRARGRFMRSPGCGSAAGDFAEREAKGCTTWHAPDHHVLFRLVATYSLVAGCATFVNIFFLLFLENTICKALSLPAAAFWPTLTMLYAVVCQHSEVFSPDEDTKPRLWVSKKDEPNAMLSSSIKRLPPCYPTSLKVRPRWKEAFG